MPSHLTRITLALTISTFLLSTGLPAQSADQPIRPAASRLWVRPADSPDAIASGIEAGENTDHRTGFGASVGALLGSLAE